MKNYWKMLVELLRLLGKPDTTGTQTAVWLILARHVGWAIVLLAGGTAVSAPLGVWLTLRAG